jgi:monomeric isocitrate dehydrogenase
MENKEELREIASEIAAQFPDYTEELKVISRNLEDISSMLASIDADIAKLKEVR